MSVGSPLRKHDETTWYLLKLLEQRGRVETQVAYRTLAERLRLTAEELRVIIYPDRPESRWRMNVGRP